jgi:nickel/cobalt exporter
MPDLAHLLAQGSTNLWIFIPSAVLLGALHGLEPGHSKTMMAAFIIAIRGTVGQAVLLGLAATASHTAVVWLVALGGLYFGKALNVETNEPWFQLASAAIIIGIALWMLWRTWREGRLAHAQHPHHHDHDHDHDHGHGHHHHDHGPAATPDLAAALEAVEGYRDPHELAHAADIQRRFDGKVATTGQIVLFGLTGGLIPCPASITVLLLCLQLKKVALGAGLVLCFSLGLALTMVAVGVVAAISVRQVERRWSGFGAFARRAPYASSALMLAVGGLVGINAAAGLLG